MLAEAAGGSPPCVAGEWRELPKEAEAWVPSHKRRLY